MKTRDGEQPPPHQRIGLETRKYLENGQVDMLGELLIPIGKQRKNDQIISPIN